MDSDLIFEHFNELQKKYSNLKMEFENNIYIIRGNIRFYAQFESYEPIEDAFDIEIVVSSTYPESPPVAKEIGGRIPKRYHTFENGTLCLGAPLAVKLTFYRFPSLLGFVEKQLIPYLYSFSYQQKNGKQMPYGELAHGADGLLSYYKELFEVTSDISVTEFLFILASNRYRGHLQCPCKSGKRIRSCHGGMIINLQKYQTQDQYEYELKECVDLLKQNRGR